METWDMGLDEIDWSGLNHAYGDASDVPALLRGLVSDDAELSQECLYELCGNIWHQGTIYEATSYAIPFLIRIHSSVGGQAKVYAANLLMLAGAGKGYYEVHSEIGIRPNGEESLDTVLVQEREHKEAVRTALKPALVELADYRKHLDIPTRELAYYLIAENSTAIPEANHLLKVALETESDEHLYEILSGLVE